LQKLESSGSPFVRFDIIQYQNVSDRQTDRDRQTDISAMAIPALA